MITFAVAQLELDEDDPDALTQYLEKREKNRLAAQKCRNKKRDKTESLQKVIYPSVSVSVSDCVSVSLCVCFSVCLSLCLSFSLSRSELEFTGLTARVFELCSLI